MIDSLLSTIMSAMRTRLETEKLSFLSIKKLEIKLIYDFKMKVHIM